MAALKEQAQLAERRLAIEQRTRERISQTGMSEGDARAQASAEADRADKDRQAKERRFLRDQAVAIAKNEALNSGDHRGARGIEDRERLRKLTEENITKGGLGADGAAALARRRLQSEIGAQEKGKGIKVVSDNLQRIGGGGSSMGSDPAQRARERMVELAKDHNRKLQEIIDGGGPV